MGKTGLHLLSVAYRREQDMTIWINGRDRNDRLQLEWSELFSDDGPDAGVAVDADGASGRDDGVTQDCSEGTDDSGSDLAGDEGAGAQADACSSCSSAGTHGSYEEFVFLGLLLLVVIRQVR